MANDEHHQVFDDKLSVLLIIIGSVALIVTIYHCVSFWCYSWWQISLFNPIGRVLRRGSVNGRADQETRSSIENSVAHLIPAHIYKKGLDLEGQDITCAVCLCEFQEGEELKTLPECMHKFHMPCIDMWLYSHSNCPICRANATPSIELLQTSSDSSDHHLNIAHPTIRIDVGSLFVHTRLI